MTVEPLAADEVDRLLERVGVGTLALPDEPAPYAVPMAFGYDRATGTAAMQFGADGRSEKLDGVAGGTPATLTARTRTETGWESAVVRGTLTVAGAADRQRALAAIADNAAPAPGLDMWGVEAGTAALTLVTLAVEDRTGRRFGPG